MIHNRTPTLLAVAELSHDMAETLVAYFPQYAVDGVVEVEVTTAGLWLVNPFGGRQFLGLARISATPDAIH